MSSLRLAITADLHWGIRAEGDAATRQVLAHLSECPPDLLILAGDIGAGDDFERCLSLFDSLACRKALVPGNHDIWVRDDDDRGDSFQVYGEHLPGVSAAHGFHYLDHAPLILADHGLAIIGSINWYDYSWSIDELPAFADDWADRLRQMRFTRGRHNDRRFVRWETNDLRFTDFVVARMDRHLGASLSQVPAAILVTHHPTFQGLNYPAEGPATLDRMLWRAFSGNRALERVVEAHAGKVAMAFCGHTHKATESVFAGARGYNIGGDYHWKRLLEVDWPSGKVTAREFHASGAGEPSA
jgi:3',5'-cyclic AMP phosphodiesterase CpdA